MKRKMERKIEFNKLYHDQKFYCTFEAVLKFSHMEINTRN